MGSKDVSRARQRNLLALTCISVLVLVLSVLDIFPWFLLFYSKSEIDISNGRIRYSYYVLLIKIHDRIFDSNLTDAIPPGDRDDVPSDWHIVNRFSLGSGYSPHYSFHLAIMQTDFAKKIWDKKNYGQSQRMNSSKKILKLWRDNKNYFGAQEYLESINF